MSYLAGLLLMVYDSDEAAVFYVLIGMMKSYLHQYFTDKMPALFHDTEVLEFVLEDACPGVAKKFQEVRSFATNLVLNFDIPLTFNMSTISSSISIPSYSLPSGS